MTNSKGIKADYRKENYCISCGKVRPRPARYCPDCNNLVRQKPRGKVSRYRLERLNKLRY